MKPAPFDYQDPRTIDRVIELLAEYGDEAKILAGGQSLIPLLNLRLSRPSLLIDINRVAGLGGIERTERGVRIGALTRQVSLERSPLIAQYAPLLTAAVRWVAHPQIRTRGTVGGSAAHSDSGAELPAALLALQADFVCRSVRGTRTVPAADFFLGQYESALAPDELLVVIDVAQQPVGTGSGFAEYSRRRGDFAIAGAAVLIEADSAGRCARAAISMFGVAGSAVRLSDLEDQLRGRPLPTNDQGWNELSLLVRAAADRLNPAADLHGDQAFRREIAAVVAEKAIREAIQDSGARSGRAPR